MNASYGFPLPPIATTVMVQKQEMVSPQLGAPLYTEYDRDGLLLDLFGSFDGTEFDVRDVAITGTRFSVLKLVEGVRLGEDGKRTLLEDMNLWCEREHEKEMSSKDSMIDLRSEFRGDLKYDLEGRS